MPFSCMYGTYLTEQTFKGCSKLLQNDRSRQRRMQSRETSLSPPPLHLPTVIHYSVVVPQYYISQAEITSKTD